MVEKVLAKAGAMVGLQVMMYKALVQEVFFYESESWVVADVILKFLEGFHHKVDRRIAGMTDR